MHGLIGFGTLYIQIETGKQYYERIRGLDPCRLEGMDAYSELLYAEGKRQELTSLAQQMHAVDPQRAETCAVIGNVYSLREQHAPALLYFKKVIPFVHYSWLLVILYVTCISIVEVNGGSLYGRICFHDFRFSYPLTSSMSI